MVFVLAFFGVGDIMNFDYEKQFLNLEKKIKKKINKVYNTYLNIINLNINWEDLILYQNLLIEILFEEKKLEIPFRKQLNKIKQYKDKVSEANNITNIIERLEQIEKIVLIFGDFLCWIFYKNDFELMDNHIKKQKTTINSAGSGISAEIECIKKLNSPDNPTFYLYNGISSYLRIGDLSVFDKSLWRIIGMGEIKSSKPDNGNIEITVDFILKKEKIGIPKKSNIKMGQNSSFLEEHMKEHLEKQLKTMRDSLTVHNNSIRLQHKVDIPHYKDLQVLINKCHKNGFAIRKISNDIVYMSVKNSLEVDKYIDSFEKEPVIEILSNNPKEGQNNIIYSSMDLLSYGKNEPFLFSPISNNSKKKALNQTFFIIFNYNSIIEYFYKYGFEFVKKKKIPYLQKIDGKKHTLICLQSINELYINMMLDEKAAINIMNKMIKENKFDNKNKQIYMNIRYIGNITNDNRVGKEANKIKNDQ